MPKRGTRFSQEQTWKDEKENVQPTRISPNLAGIPFTLSILHSGLKQTYSSTLQISLDNEIHSCHPRTCQTISVLFLPKFHCELDFIEQCWGHAKRLYRQKPPSSSEEDLEKNLVGTLDSVTVEQMRKYARRSRRFMNAYQKGLTGKQPAWATKKYRGHRVLPDSILAELEEAGI